MTFKEFGEIVQQETPKFKEFGEVVKEKPKTSRARSIASAPIRGAIEGGLDILELADTVRGVFGQEPGVPKIKEFLNLEENLDKYLPTQDRPLEKGLKRVGRLGTSSFIGPGGLAAKAVRTGAAAGLGQLAEETGAPEWGQALAELSAFMSPSFGKKLLPRKSQKEAVEFLKAKGLTDKEIVPLIKQENFINRNLAKLAPKSKKTEQFGKGIRKKLGKEYDILKTTGEEKFLRGDAVRNFDDKLSEVIRKINPRFGRLIEKDVEALRNRGISQKNLIDFYEDINAVIGPQKKGKAVLGILKKPIMEGLGKIDPQAAKDFNMLNNFYAKSHEIAKNLKPADIEKWFSAGKALAAGAALGTGNFPILIKIAGTHAAQLAVKEMLHNPRLQNLTLQMGKAVAQNKRPVVLRTLTLFEKELRKNNPEAADAIHQSIHSPD